MQQSIQQYLLAFILSCLVLDVMAAPVPSRTEQPDPLGSPAWITMVRMVLHQEPVVFDDRVKVTAPISAEDSMHVPVSIQVEGIADIQDIVVFSDLNPIPKILSFKPTGVDPYLAFRFKVQQSTPVRAAVKTRDGVWHVGGQWIDAAGGGCTTASVGMASGNWTDTLGQVTAKRWPQTSHASERLRFKIMHPMDTGLAPGIPAFYITDLSLSDANGNTLASLKLYEPVNENPVLSLNLSDGSATPIQLEGRDNNGNRFHAEIAAP